MRRASVLVRGFSTDASNLKNVSWPQSGFLSLSSYRVRGGTPREDTFGEGLARVSRKPVGFDIGCWSQMQRVVTREARQRRFSTKIWRRFGKAAARLS